MSPGDEARPDEKKRERPITVFPAFSYWPIPPAYDGTCYDTLKPETLLCGKISGFAFAVMYGLAAYLRIPSSFLAMMAR